MHRCTQNQTKSLPIRPQGRIGGVVLARLHADDPNLQPLLAFDRRSALSSSKQADKIVAGQDSNISILLQEGTNIGYDLLPVARIQPGKHKAPPIVLCKDRTIPASLPQGVVKQRQIGRRVFLVQLGCNQCEV